MKSPQLCPFIKEDKYESHSVPCFRKRTKSNRAFCQKKKKKEPVSLLGNRVISWLTCTLQAGACPFQASWDVSPLTACHTSPDDKFWNVGP